MTRILAGVTFYQHSFCTLADLRDSCLPFKNTFFTVVGCFAGNQWDAKKEMEEHMIIGQKIPGKKKVRATDLAGCEFFGDFALSDRARVLAFSLIRVLGAGEQLFEEGSPCRALHLVLDGEVKMNKISPEGKEQVIRRLGPGKIFGAAPLFTAEGTYPATAVSVSTAKVLVVPKAELIRFLKQKPELMLKVLAHVSQHLQEMMRLAERVSLDPVPRRVAGYLLTLAAATGGPKSGQLLRLDRTQAELASQLGTVREVLGRALRGFQRDGVLRLRGRQILLLRPEALRSA